MRVEVGLQPELFERGGSTIRKGGHREKVLGDGKPELPAFQLTESWNREREGGFVSSCREKSARYPLESDAGGRRIRCCGCSRWASIGPLGPNGGFVSLLF